MTSLVIVGAGGFGREVHGLVSALIAHGAKWEHGGFIDDEASEEDRARVRDLGSAIVGAVPNLGTWRTPCAAVIAVGSPTARAAIFDVLKRWPLTFPALVHPDATVGTRVELAPGVVIAAGARLSTNISVGHHVHVDQNATVGHDAVLGDFSRLNPQACVSGNVRVGPGSTIGANATILQGLDVGSRVVVGAGSVVTHDIAAGAIVKGVPAR